MSTIVGRPGDTCQQVTTLTVVSCPACGIIYGIPQAFYEKRREDGQSWRCPTNHSLSFHETELMRVQKKLELTRVERDTQAERTTKLLCERTSLRHQLHGTRGSLVKLKKRVVGGVCPCCSRTFSNVVAHMRTQHPHELDTTLANGKLHAKINSKPTP